MTGLAHEKKTTFEDYMVRTWCLYTVPLKGKLTVSTRNSILDPRSFRESRIEFRGSSFENRVSSFETLEEFFEDLEQRFRGNDLILENKTIAMNKTIVLTRGFVRANPL